MDRVSPARSLVLATAAAVAVIPLVAGLDPAPTRAHGPDPLFGSTRWQQDQVVGYQWAAGWAPPGWMAAAIDAGAKDVEESRHSRAATFTRVSRADSRIWYGGLWPCPAYGIACVDRTGVPDSFTGMWFRIHGHAFDWGVLRWCQGMAAPANGCYDAENVALDEFGHIEILGHHVNFDDESDFLDAVVQFAARSRPRPGWNEHEFGRCDIARLQLEYELISASDPVSTCLSLATSLAIVPGSTWLSPGQSVRVSGTLKVAATTGARALSGDPLSKRSISLQRRPPGGTTWASIGTLAANSVEGSYGLTISPTQTYDYRLVYSATADEGLRTSWTAPVRIVVSSCPHGSVSSVRDRTRAPDPMAPCEF